MIGVELYGCGGIMRCVVQCLCVLNWLSSIHDCGDSVVDVLSGVGGGGSVSGWSSL